MPDQGKLDALASAGYLELPACWTCVHFTAGSPGWGYCDAIKHDHSKHGVRGLTGVRISGSCPKHERDEFEKAELDRSGYVRFVQAP